MKKFTFTALLLAIMSLALNTSTVEAVGNHNALAISAFRQSCNYTGAIRASAPWPVAKCFTGFVMRINIIPKIKFSKFASVLRIGAVGHVDIDCNGNVVNVTCY